MPEPVAHPQFRAIFNVARLTLAAGVVVMAAKFGIYHLTGSAAVLSDAMESIVNILAAAFMLYSLWLSNQPADRDHPYGHGKIEFMTLGLEGWMILAAGALIAWVAIGRLFNPVAIQRLDLGLLLLAAVNLCNGGLAAYVYWMGRRHESPVLRADGKHLATDFASTLGVLLGLGLVRWTGWWWLDPVVALIVAGLILFTSWKLLWESVDGLMDRSDPRDDALVRRVLDEEVASGTIKAYHKVRHRHSGRFHWVDLHLQVDPALSVRQSHDLATRVEIRIETALGQGQCNATAHVEPYDAEAPGHTIPPKV